MIYSFEIIIDEKTSEYFISNLKEDRRNLLGFPTDGVDIEYIDRDTNCYRVYFDDDVELNRDVEIYGIIHEVKTTFLRSHKIKKIVDR